MKTTHRLAAWIRRRRDARSYDCISTETLERFRDHAAANGLDSSREHYEYILAVRAANRSTP